MTLQITYSYIMLACVTYQSSEAEHCAHADLSF